MGRENNAKKQDRSANRIILMNKRYNKIKTYYCLFTINYIIIPAVLVPTIRTNTTIPAIFPIFASEIVFSPSVNPVARLFRNLVRQLSQSALLATLVLLCFNHFQILCVSKATAVFTRLVSSVFIIFLTNFNMNRDDQRKRQGSASILQFFLKKLRPEATNIREQRWAALEPG